MARQAVRESLVLLKNDGKVLPLSKKAARIHVAGKSADDIGNQCGGWTIDWQGKTRRRDDRRHDHPRGHQERPSPRTRK